MILFSWLNLPHLSLGAPGLSGAFVCVFVCLSFRSLSFWFPILDFVPCPKSTQWLKLSLFSQRVQYVIIDLFGNLTPILLTFAAYIILTSKRVLSFLTFSASCFPFLIQHLKLNQGLMKSRTRLYHLWLSESSVQGTMKQLHNVLC